MINHKNPVCFISYCHEDTKESEINFIIDCIKEKTKKKCDILFDKDLGLGRRFDDFMSALNNVDLVIIFCTPKYKEKAENQMGGVGTEYSIITERYKKILQERKEVNNEFLAERKVNFFEIYPIILKGDSKTSVPNEFITLNSLKMTYFKLNTQKYGGNSDYSISQSIKKSFYADIEKIIENIRSYFRIKQDTYSQILEQTYENLKIESLFRDTKADFNNPKFKLSNFQDTLFVRTYAYKQVESQASYFLIGRKGSGKSSITQVLPMRVESASNYYAGVVDIYANRDMNFSILYHYFSSDEFMSDTKNVFKRIYCFRYSWALFFRIGIMDILCNMDNDNLLNNYTANKLKKIREFMNELNLKIDNHKYPTKNKRHYFTYCFNAIQRFMKNCIDNARKDEEYFISDIDGNFTMKNFLKFALSKDIEDDLDSIFESIPKKFLITFDGFDTEIEKFREEIGYLESDNIKSKVLFEIDWLHSLLILVNDIKQLNSGNDKLNPKVDFCLTIPNHRFTEILRYDIDAYRFLHKRKIIAWSGVELALFLRKRLEIASDYRVNNEKAPIETLTQVLKEKFKFLPKDIEFEFNDKWIKMPLFLYVLRHTFWRPRDILIFYVHIITLCLNAIQNDHIVRNESIRISIANCTFEIIKADFINEYKGTIRNIVRIIEKFKGFKQVLTFNEANSILYDIIFEFVVVSNEQIKTSIISKIKFLYQIGFLGVLATDEQKEMFNLYCNHAFIFNEGAKIMRKFNSSSAEKYTFIIHPLFCEYLGLNTSENEFIFDITWEYIIELEGFMMASNDDFDLDLYDET
jgi:hypothetical protein